MLRTPADRQRGPGKAAEVTSGEHATILMTADNPPLLDPVDSLSPTALELLEAARQLTVSGGWEALRLDSVVARAGKNKASVKYHFGNKAGLVSALVAQADNRRAQELAEVVKDAADTERLEQFLAAKRSLLDDRDDAMMWLALLPHVLRDDAMRVRLAELYDWYRGMTLSHLGIREGSMSQDEARGLASLLMAVGDGLLIQTLLDQDDSTENAALEMLRRLLQGDFNLSHVQGGTSDDPGQS